jgi:hypothetical protein
VGCAERRRPARASAATGIAGVERAVGRRAASARASAASAGGMGDTAAGHTPRADVGHAAAAGPTRGDARRTFGMGDHAVDLEVGVGTFDDSAAASARAHTGAPVGACRALVGTNRSRAGSLGLGHADAGRHAHTPAAYGTDAAAADRTAAASPRRRARRRHSR